MKPSIVFYDNINGFIRLNQVETELVNTPFLQRLRWIKQLGFSEYVFPGACHNRLTHQIGVLHVADRMIRAIGKAVPDEKLFDPKCMDEATQFHKSVRIAAMLHDVGHFPFSHTTEAGYIIHGRETNNAKTSKKNVADNHEHLGSYIIKNTDYPGGITHVLKKYGFDFQEISRLVKGNSAIPLANQILHSDVDADRMDYLIRDAYHTGIRYGQIDRDFILHHLTTFQTDGVEVLGFKENARYAVEDLLQARFSWYSQVIKDPTGAKYDIVAAHLTNYFLKNKLIYSFQDLLELARKDAEKFFGFNDFYFMTLVQKAHESKKHKNTMVQELIKAILFRQGPKSLKIELFQGKIMSADNPKEKKALLNKIQTKIKELEATIKKYGKGNEWILTELPTKDIQFTATVDHIVKGRKSENILLERDPVKIVSKHGEPKLLIQLENSVINRLSGLINFIPNVYCNAEAFSILKAKNLI